MKAKIVLMILSLFFAPMQFFGQGSNMTAANDIKTSSSSTGNREIDAVVKPHSEQASLKSTVEITEELKLEISCDANSYSDEALVVFNNSDPTQGASKLMSMYATAPELWSVKNGLKYSISFLGGLDSTIIVPLTVKAGLPGNYTLTSSQLESFGANIEISLEDHVLGTSINLGIAPSYTFQVTEIATIANRFYLRFQDLTSAPGKEITSVRDKEVAGNFNMYTIDGAIMITSLQQQSGKVAVFDINGRKVAAGSIEAGANTRIDMHSNTGVYIVSVLSGKRISNTKIIVR